MRRSQPAIWFRLANVWLTTIPSADTRAEPHAAVRPHVTRAHAGAETSARSTRFQGSPLARPLRGTQTTDAAADGHMSSASGRDIQTRPAPSREADRDSAMSAAGVIPRAVWTPRA